MPTIAQAITEGARRLSESNIDESRRTAGLLLCNVLDTDRTRLLTESQEEIGEAQYAALISLVERRAAGEPLQYITGHQEFYGLDFIVTPDALIPRPETEHLVERVIALSQGSRNKAPLIADIGTGSGCIAVSLAANIKGARLIATDVSQVAVNLARKNAERHGVRERIQFLVGDLLAPLAGLEIEGKVDVLASNPPYVVEGWPELIQREVREWEPHEALYGGPDGLDFYRRLLTASLEYVRPCGCLVLEIGYSQLDAVSEMIDKSSWELVDVTRDLQGIPRTVTAKKRSENP